MTHSEEDLIAIMESFCAALNAGNLDVALTFLTDDILYTLGSQPLSEKEPAPLAIAARGKQQTHDAVKSLISDLNLETWDYQVSGNRLTCKFRNSSDFYRRMGLDFVDGTGEVAFRGDKIEAFHVIYSREAVRKLWAAQEE